MCMMSVKRFEVPKPRMTGYKIMLQAQDMLGYKLEGRYGFPWAGGSIRQGERIEAWRPDDWRSNYEPGFHFYPSLKSARRVRGLYSAAKPPVIVKVEAEEIHAKGKDRTFGNFEYRMAGRVVGEKVRRPTVYVCKWITILGEVK